MTRRISTDRGHYLPQLAAGIRARAEWVTSAMPGIGTSRRDALDRGERFLITVTDAWSALFAIDEPAAAVFRSRHPGAWDFRRPPLFEYDPRTGVLTGQGTW